MTKEEREPWEQELYNNMKSDFEKVISATRVAYDLYVAQEKKYEPLLKELPRDEFEALATEEMSGLTDELNRLSGHLCDLDGKIAETMDYVTNIFMGQMQLKNDSPSVRKI